MLIQQCEIFELLLNCSDNSSLAILTIAAGVVTLTGSIQLAGPGPQSDVALKTNHQA